MASLRVNVISESAFTTKGHGVHTAFVETVNSLRRQSGIEVQENGRATADIIHIHTIGPYSLQRLLFWPGKKVVSAHVTPDSFVGSLVGAKYWYRLAAWYLRWFYNRADAVLAVSMEVEQELKRMGVKRPITLVPNTIDTRQYSYTAEQRTAARTKLELRSDQKLVIGCGQVQPRKGIDSFLVAAAALPETQFIWVGGVPFKQLAADHAHMEQIMKHPPANVRFTGVIDHEKVIDYYRAADIFFLPSHQETFGIVIVEAAAAGLPVVLRDLDQYKVTFKGHYNAAISDDGFIDELKKLIGDRAYYERSVAASVPLAQTYDSLRGGEQLVALYRTL